MEISTDFATYAQWSGILTLVCLLLTIVAFVFRWGFRFRLVGATGFMGVLTFGLFALALSLFTRIVIPGAIRYQLIYDNGSTEAVIVVPPQIQESEIEPTLLQAASDLYSYGRSGLASDKLTIRMRTLIHPELGVSKPVYLGQIKRSLARRQDDEVEIEVFSENLAQLPQETSS